MLLLNQKEITIGQRIFDSLLRIFYLDAYAWWYLNRSDETNLK